MPSVYYSFKHINQSPSLATGYAIYRQSGDSDYKMITGIAATETSVNNIPITITGVDIVEYENVQYNYKVSALNANAEVYAINPNITGITFP